MALRRNAFTYGVAIPFAIVLAFPFVWMFITSLKPEAQVYDPTKTWRFHPTLASYGYLFHHTDYVRWLENSFFVGLLVVLITLVVALPAGYALARLAGGVGRSLGVGIFLTYLVPPTLLFLPLSRVVAQYLHLSDRLWSLIVVYPSFTIPFAIWLLMGFFKTIPQELEDAALVDGCGRFGSLVRVVFPISLPLQLPIAIVAVLFGIVFTATDMVVPYILTNGGPFNSTQMITTYAFTTGINAGNIGEGAAIALFLLPVLAVVAVGMLVFARRAEVT